jgi:hypothetical protein
MIAARQINDTVSMIAARQLLDARRRLLPRHGHLINAGRRRGTLATGASSKPDADGRLDLLPPLATGRDSIWWNLPLADEPPPLTDDFLLTLPILGS